MRTYALYRDHNLHIVFGVALVAVLRSDSITPAFPDLVRALRIPAESVGLLITAFALPSIFLTPILGVLADRWGRKRVLVPALMLFGLAGGASALARDFRFLLGLRLLQGIGAASLSMLNITLIADLYSGRECTAAMGYNATVRSIGSTLYPLIGGVLATPGWYYPFALSLLAIPVALLVQFTLRNPEPRRDTQFAEYVRHARESLRTREVAGLFIAGCVVFIIMFGAYLAYFPLLLEEAFLASPLVIGWLISGRSLINAIIASQIGRITRFCAEETLLKTAFVLYALALAAILLAPSLWFMVLITFILGTAEGLYWPANHALLGKLAPAEHRAGFLAVNDTVLKLGQTLGPLLMAGVFGLWRIQGTFYVAAMLSLATFALTMVTVRSEDIISLRSARS
ncbi:MAG TPA: MFS transporter [Caldilineae bacterium]|nr:MFS transporter [Caldilineae bacterium]